MDLTMFESLSENLGKIFDKLKGRGFLSEDDVNAAMREVRIALLEADVALPVVKEFINSVKEKAIGTEVLKSITPSQMVIKIVQDQLTVMLGSENNELSLQTAPPAVIMMAGLQGSGKTTTSAKIALRLKEKQHKKTLLASLDVARPAAQEQLAVLATQAGVASLPIIKGETPVQIAKRALQTAKLEGFDVVILDTAGRLHIDETLMSELVEIKKLASPVETLLVADSLTGQDAVNVAKEFHEKLTVTGIILTRIDGDNRGGAALSMRSITGCPIKFLGSGEKLTELEEFHPDRIASRILDMGDIVSLVERAAETINQEDAERLAKKVQKGTFDLNDLAEQLKTIRKMGGVGGLMGMLPGMKKIKSQLADANIDEKIIIRQEAIISSMTKQERKNAKIINASRRRRIAIGSGVTVQDVNRLLKQYQDMSTMMKKVSKMDKKSFMRSGLGNLFS
jgi:signal recognition particle subunit SRP54